MTCALDLLMSFLSVAGYRHTDDRNRWEDVQRAAGCAVPTEGGLTAVEAT